MTRKCHSVREGRTKKRENYLLTKHWGEGEGSERVKGKRKKMMVQNSLTMTSHFSRIFSALFPKLSCSFRPLSNLLACLLPHLLVTTLVAHWLLTAYLLTCLLPHWLLCQQLQLANKPVPAVAQSVWTTPQKMMINSIQFFSGMCGACMEAQVMFSSI